MAEIIRGKGVISGIAMGKIMLAGQNLDGYLVNYEPEDKETEKKKAQDALTLSPRSCARASRSSRART